MKPKGPKMSGTVAHIPVSSRQRQEKHKFKASLVHMVSYKQPKATERSGWERGGKVG